MKPNRAPTTLVALSFMKRFHPLVEHIEKYLFEMNTCGSTVIVVVSLTGHR